MVEAELAIGLPPEHWDVQTISDALDACRDPKLYVAMCLLHAYGGDSGAYLGNTHISDENIVRNDAYHAQAQMLTEIYAHIIDEDRKVNAQKFEAAFYSNPDLRGVRAPEPRKYQRFCAELFA